MRGDMYSLFPSKGLRSNTPRHLLSLQANDVSQARLPRMLLILVLTADAGKGQALVGIA